MTSLSSLQEVLPALCCPDDGSDLNYQPDELRCVKCGRAFPILEGNIADMLPSAPSALDGKHFGSEYRANYQQEFTRPFQTGGNNLPWGAAETLVGKHRLRKQKQVEFLTAAVKSTCDPTAGIVCDLTGGAGHYSLALAPISRFVLHCDLSLDSLLYTAKRARRAGISNIAFLRIDYLELPFRRSLDCVLCIDTLIRGREHEEQLLKSIRRAVRRGGTAVVDFHNWWHNPARRLGLLHENFRQNRSYGRAEVERMLESAGLQNYRYLPFHQEALTEGLRARVTRALMPVTRHTFVAG